MPNNKPGSRLIKAAGGVAWRPAPDGELEILLVHRKKYDDWSLPKGKAEPDEPLPVTAVREVLEEGGARLALGRRLASVRYNAGGRPKRVHYWAARVLSVDEHAVPNSEVDEVTWLPAAAAVDKVSYAHDHGVLADFAGRPAQTVPLILLRHSRAVSKSGWRRPDRARPLDGSGRSEAKALADLLECFASRPRLISSSAVRCTDTLRPLSRHTGEPVRAEPSLYVDKESPRTGAADSDADVAALVREVIASGEPTVICAHRENLPVLQKAALAALAGHYADDSGASVPRDAIAELPSEWKEPLPTSGFWVLNVGRLPPEPDPEPPMPEAPVPDPAQAVPARTPPSGPVASPLARSRGWWRRILGRAASPGLPDGDASPSDRPGPDAPRVEQAARSGAGGDVHAGERDDGEASAAAADPGSAVGSGSTGRPVGMLVSADRYDLSES
jgi:8-oxo-dGTP pyrophosphatase MutT (NUDIX family)/phosphohistidine phosphatase SixA